MHRNRSPIASIALSLFFSFVPSFSSLSSQVSLNMMTACAAEELKNDEILFSSLHPGWVRTEMGGENVSKQFSLISLDWS